MVKVFCDICKTEIFTAGFGYTVTITQMVEREGQGFTHMDLCATCEHNLWNTVRAMAVIAPQTALCGKCNEAVLKLKPGEVLELCASCTTARTGS